MSRFRRAVPLTLLALSCLACRAKPEACEDIAAHVAALAEAEDKGGAGTEVTIESTCKQDPPTRAYAKCVLAAGDLAALEGC